jgi:hypothetical protein
MEKQVIRTYSRSEQVEMNSAVGKVGEVSIEELLIGVKIVNERFRYGHYDVLVSPLIGKGEKWVEFHKVRVKS